MFRYPHNSNFYVTSIQHKTTSMFDSDWGAKIWNPEEANLDEILTHVRQYEQMTVTVDIRDVRYVGETQKQVISGVEQWLKSELLFDITATCNKGIYHTHDIQKVICSRIDIYRDAPTTICYTGGPLIRDVMMPREMRAEGTFNMYYETNEIGYHYTSMNTLKKLQFLK